MTLQEESKAYWVARMMQKHNISEADARAELEAEEYNPAETNINIKAALYSGDIKRVS